MAKWWIKKNTHKIINKNDLLFGFSNRDRPLNNQHLNATKYSQATIFPPGHEPLCKMQDFVT